MNVGRQIDVIKLRETIELYISLKKETNLNNMYSYYFWQNGMLLLMLLPSGYDRTTRAQSV